MVQPVEPHKHSVARGIVVGLPPLFDGALSDETSAVHLLSL